MPPSHLILCFPLLLQPSIFPSIRVFSNESDLRIRWPNYWNFGFNLSLSNEYSACSPRGSQESYSKPQFKSINSLVLSFLYGSILTSIHDYWKNHSFDKTDLFWQSNISLICCLGLSYLFFQEASIF